MGMWNFFRHQQQHGDSPGGTDGPPRAPAGVLGWLRNLVGWPGADAARNTPAERTLIIERTRSGPQGVVLPWFLPYFDAEQTLFETGTMRLAYRRMLSDPNVKAALFGKILSVCSLELKVQPADRRNKQQAADAELVRWNLEEALEGGMPGLIWAILSGAMIDGFSICEKIWSRETTGTHRGAYYLRAVKPKDTGRDVILMTDEFRNIVGVQGLRYNPGTIFSPANFLIYRHLPMWDTATGQSDLRAVYSRFWMLDCILKLRAVGLEKRALPVIVGHYTHAQDMPAVEQALSLVKSQNWLAVPETVRVEALSIAGGADSQFASAVQDLKHDIFLGIAGAILQSIEGSTTDGRGNSQVHRSTADLFVWHLSSAIQSLLNDRRHGLVRDIIDLNRVVDVYPKVTLASVDEKDILSRMQTRKMFWEMGGKQSLEDMYDEMGIQPPDPNDPLDSLGGKADQEAQVAAATIAAPGGPAGAAAADRVLTDHTRANAGYEEVTQSPEPTSGGGPGLEQMVEMAEGDDDLEERLRKAGWGVGEYGGSLEPFRGDAATPPRGKHLTSKLPADIAGHLTPTEHASIKRGAINDLVSLHNSLPDGEQWEAAATAGRAKRGWYANATKSLIRLIPDEEDRRRLVGLLAATSPRAPVKKNLQMTFRIWADWRRRGESKDPAVLKRMLGMLGDDWSPEMRSDLASVRAKMKDAREKRKAGIALTSADALTPGEADLLARVPKNPIQLGFMPSSHGPNVIKALSGDLNEPLSGPKVDSFRQNLLGDLHRSTNDVWMAYFGGVDHGVLGKPYGYHAMTAKIRETAAKLGWHPAEVQETIWSYFRELARLQKGERDPREALRDITHEGVNRTPDFATLLAGDPHVQKEAGRSSSIAERIGNLRADPRGLPQGGGGSGGEEEGRPSGPVHPGAQGGTSRRPSRSGRKLEQQRQEWEDSQLPISERAGEHADSIRESGEDSQEMLAKQAESIGHVGHDWNDHEGIDTPIHSGAGVDSIGRRYGVAAGKRISLKRHDEDDDIQIVHDDDPIHQQATRRDPPPAEQSAPIPGTPHEVDDLFDPAQHFRPGGTAPLPKPTTPPEDPAFHDRMNMLSLRAAASHHLHAWGHDDLQSARFIPPPPPSGGSRGTLNQSLIGHVSVGGHSAFYKGHSGEFARREEATARLNGIAGLKSPAVRHAKGIPGAPEQYQGAGGMLMEMIPGDSLVDEIKASGGDLSMVRGRLRPGEADRAALAGFLTGTADRHGGNFIVSGDRLVSIDHEFSLWNPPPAHTNQIPRGPLDPELIRENVATSLASGRNPYDIDFDHAFDPGVVADLANRAPHMADAIESEDPKSARWIRLHGQALAEMARTGRTSYKELERILRRMRKEITGSANPGHDWWRH